MSSSYCGSRPLKDGRKGVHRCLLYVLLPLAYDPLGWDPARLNQLTRLGLICRYLPNVAGAVDSIDRVKYKQSVLNLRFWRRTETDMAKTLLQVREQIARLQMDEERLRRAEAAEVIGKIKLAIDAYRLTPADLFGIASSVGNESDVIVGAARTEVKSRRRADSSSPKTKVAGAVCRRTGQRMGGPRSSTSLVARSACERESLVGLCRHQGCSQESKDRWFR